MSAHPDPARKVITQTRVLGHYMDMQPTLHFTYKETKPSSRETAILNSFFRLSVSISTLELDCDSGKKCILCLQQGDPEAQLSGHLSVSGQKSVWLAD